MKPMEVRSRARYLVSPLGHRTYTSNGCYDLGRGYRYQGEAAHCTSNFGRPLNVLGPVVVVTRGSA